MSPPPLAAPTPLCDDAEEEGGMLSKLGKGGGGGAGGPVDETPLAPVVATGPGSAS
jgi:hypothetical protein